MNYEQFHNILDQFKLGFGRKNKLLDHFKKIEMNVDRIKM